MEVGVVRRVGDVDDSEEEVDVEERVEVVRVVRVGVADMLDGVVMRWWVGS